ncbi:MAG: hypothetical protein J6V16_02570, partial [Bacteroidales bacterium]|nr:hypothetical protein [Bacteroidales bacterium]
NVDTGMGLERALCVLNGKSSVYETDIFENAIKAISQLTGKNYDDNEETLWKIDGKVQTAWIEFQPSRQVALKECCLKLSDWRKKTYRLRISGYCPTESGVEEVILWEGETEKSLGYITLPLAESAPVGKIRIEALSDNGKASLSIVEAEFYARQLGH